MNLRPGHKEESVEVNLTPLIDVVFLLLIFFMVSTTFDKHAKLKVSLPEATAKATQQQNDPLVLSIDAKGNYFINDRQVVNQTLDTLKQALSKTIGDDKDIALMLRADANTPHQSVVRAMDAASQLGLTRLSIATVEGK
jgi:biopolymer transport protein ExbD